MSDTPLTMDHLLERALSHTKQLHDTLALAGCEIAYTAELVALRKDKERLDWLDENMSYHGGGSGGTYSFSTPADVESGLLRVAIDAAIAKQ